MFWEMQRARADRCWFTMGQIGRRPPGPPSLYSVWVCVCVCVQRQNFSDRRHATHDSHPDETDTDQPAHPTHRSAKTNSRYEIIKRKRPRIHFIMMLIMPPLIYFSQAGQAAGHDLRGAQKIPMRERAPTTTYSHNANCCLRDRVRDQFWKQFLPHLQTWEYFGK